MILEPQTGFIPRHICCSINTVTFLGSLLRTKFPYQECNVDHSHLKSAAGGHTAKTATPSTTTGAAELFIHDNIAYGNPQHLHLNTITTDAAEIQICDNIAYGNLQANTNPEYERLDQLVHTYETLNQDEKMEDKPEHNGASMSYMPTD